MNSQQPVSQEPQLNTPPPQSNQFQPAQSSLHRWLPAIVCVAVVVLVGGGVFAYQTWWSSPSAPPTQEPPTGTTPTEFPETGESIQKLSNFAMCRGTHGGELDEQLQNLSLEPFTTTGLELSDFNFSPYGFIDIHGSIIQRSKSFFGDSINRVYIQIFPPDEEPYKVFYNYYSNLVDIGNTINQKVGEVLLFSLGEIEENGLFSSRAGVSQVAEVAIKDALESGDTINLRLRMTTSGNGGVPSNFSFACAIEIAGISAVGAVDETANWKTYRNEEFGFEVKYPPGGEVTKTSYGPRIVLPLEEEGTNLSEKYLDIAVDGPSAHTGSLVSSEQVFSGDKSFTKEIRGGVAAGNIYNTESYIINYEGKEYNLSFTLHSGNIFNYDPSIRPKVFNKDQEEKIFDQILSTFKFID